MTNQNICCDSLLASSVLAYAESYFWIDFLQGESVEESGSIISHYFRTYFSLYVVPRGLKAGSPVAALPSAWLYRASAGTGWPGVSVL